MPWMPNGSDIDHGFSKMIRLNRNDPEQGLVLRQSAEEYGFYLVDGVRQFPVSSKARHSGDIGRGRFLALRRYLKLDPREFKDLCECRVTGPQYHQMIRDRLGLPSLATPPS